MKRKLVQLLISVSFCCFLFSCQEKSFRKPSNSLQELNFEVFWQTYEDNYAFFNSSEVDWKETYLKFRDQVNPETTNDELFEIFCEMVKPFEDGHIHIEGSGENYFNIRRPSHYEKEFRDVDRQQFWNMVHQTLIFNGFSNVDSIGFIRNEEKLFHYSVSNDFGYFRFLRSTPKQEEGYTGPDLIQIRKDLNIIFEQFENKKALILDVRNHRGGYGEFSYEIAGRFTNSKQLGHFTSNRISGGGYEEFDSLKPKFIEPEQVYATSKFLKPVILLTNDQVGSAGEIFVMAMSQLDNVTILGDHTAGFLSTMYEFNLPNGWWNSLSSQRSFNADTILYETKGVPPDIFLQNKRQDLLKNKDPLISKALELIKE